MKNLYLLAALAMLLASCGDNNGHQTYNTVYSVEVDSKLFFTHGQKQEFEVSSYKDIVGFTITHPLGWVVTPNEEILEITAPASNTAGSEKSGQIKIIASGVDKDADPVLINVQSGIIVTFEDVPSKWLAESTEGKNLYDGYPDQYIDYTDPASGLYFTLQDLTPGFGEFSLWYGGVAFSQWNEMISQSFTNQCSVYYSDPATGYGGHNGSKTFALSYGWNDPMWPNAPSISFEDAGEEVVFDHMWVTNSTYAYLTMLNGNGFASAFTYDSKDTLVLILRGFDKNGAITSIVEHYLADFRTSASPGIQNKWEKVDLSALGAIHSLQIDFKSSDEPNTPTYLCIDDIAIRK